MGKNKPHKPKTAKAGGGGGSDHDSSASLGIGSIAALLGIVVLICAVAGMMFLGNSDVQQTMQTVKQAAKQAASGNLKGAINDLGASQLSERELLQQGRAPAGAKKARCTDSSASCTRDAKAETCLADESLRKRCCRSCHMLTCHDKDEKCEEWAMQDQCLDNTEFMRANCCWSCSPDPDDPCALDPMDRPDVYKGDIEKIFQRIITDYPEYPVTVHSKDPWLITLDNLLTDEECDGIIEAVGGKRGEYIKPSTTAKPVRQPNGQVILTDVPDQIRTSHNAWCQHRSCYDHPIHERVIQRIMNIVDLPPNNAEHMQLLRYGPNEYYRLHHDWIPEQLDAACGPRAFTFFLYLSDVEEGGGTKFPYLNVTVMPKKGTGVLWPHGLNSDPRTKDSRTHHEAMPVISGTKWGANYWIHGRDFKTSMATGCDGRQGQPKRSRLMKQGAAEARLREDSQQRR